MRKLFWLITPLALLTAIALGATFAISSQLPHKADTFFSLITRGDLSGAYTMTSKHFQETQSEEEFTLRFADPFWSTYRGIRWESRSVGLASAPKIVMKGVLEVGDMELDLDMTFLYENGSWLVDTLDVENLESAVRPIPSQEEAIGLVQETMIAFADGMERKDFSKFYRPLAQSWKDQTNPEELRKSFDPFLERELDLSFVQDMLPELRSEPHLDEVGSLVIDAQYGVPDQGGTLLVNMHRRYEKKAWKTSGFEVKFVPAE